MRYHLATLVLRVEKCRAPCVLREKTHGTLLLILQTTDFEKCRVKSVGHRGFSG